MHRRRESLLLQCPLEAAFEAALACHWPALPGGSGSRLKPGRRYLREEGRGARHGRIIDAQWPVALTLRELLVAPLPVLRVYFRYRWEPREERTLMVLETRLTLFAPGRMLPWVWQSRIIEENRHRLQRLRLVAETGGTQAGRSPEDVWLSSIVTKH
ncbi:MAG: hypothetical protein JJT93_00825 [Gammaproteobacteria bacterium]|nr:hypothetical protein [Gammaproteobacteria bacterium]